MTEDIIFEFEEVLSGNQEFESIKENAMNYENLETLEQELFALEGKVKHEKANTQNKKSVLASKVSVADTNNTSYYGQSAKYIK